MSYRIKNANFENGFARNPDKVYFEEYFDDLPSTNKTFQLTSSGNTDITFYQPANTFFKEIYVVCLTSPTLGSAGNVGVSLTVGTTAVGDFSSGTILAGAATNIINNHTTMAVKSVSQVFPITELTPTSGAVETSVGYSTTHRAVTARITSSVAITGGNEGSFKLIPVYGSLEGSLYQFNKNFSVSGTGIQSVYYDGGNGYSGVKMTTTTTANDQVLLSTDASGSSNILNNGVLKTGGRLEFEMSVVFPVLASSNNFSFVGGLKLTSTPLLTTDNDQAVFVYGNDTPLLGGSNTLLDNSSTDKLFFSYSKGGKYYITNLDIPIVADREYKLRFIITKQRKIRVYVNGVQFGLTSTEYSSGSTYGSKATNTYDESVQISNLSLYPVVGIQTSDTTASSVIVNYLKMSRDSKKV